jgi:hypothetical protein
MNRTRFGVQTLIVVTLIMLVSWPQFRPVRAASVWRTSPDAAAVRTGLESFTTSLTEDARGGTTRGRVFGLTSEEEAEAARLAARRAEDAARRNFVTPSAVAAFGATLNVLTGRARTSLNTPIPYAKVLLRDIRTGAIIARVTANEEGRFTFIDLDASSYIVELIGADGSVVAASEMVAMRNGDLRDTTLRVAVGSAVVAAAFNNRFDSTLTNAQSTANNGDITRTSGPRDVPSVSPAG